MKTNLFTKLLIMLLLILIPIAVLFSYSNLTSVQTIEKQIEESNTKQLSFFMNQIEKETEQLILLSNAISRDYSVQSLQTPLDFSTYSEVFSVQAVEQKLRLQQISGKWRNEIVVYYPNADRVVPDSLASEHTFDLSEIASRRTEPWNYEGARSDNGEFRFAHYITEPLLAKPKDIQQVVKITFSSDVLEQMLTEFNADNQGDSFLYHPQFPPITGDNPSADHRVKLIDYLNVRSISPASNERVQIGEQSYILNILPSRNLGWYLIDAVPVKQILSPIMTSRNMFYGLIAVTIIAGTLASLWLYRYVQVPMGQLLQGVRKVRHGDYSVRIAKIRNNEYSFLLSSFNHMAEEIQNLVERVYAEQLRSKEATLKQLQSQINPHFLYNCLFYIMNMASLGDEEAVMAMSSNLGEYFRYTTKNDQSSASLDDEIKLVENYLTIQNLRMKRLQFVIDIPDEMRTLEVPRLFLQPVVENAVLHGIEPKEGKGMITVRGEIRASRHRIIIEDNGIGMPQASLHALQISLTAPHQAERGYGLWNVFQRLKLQFGQNTELGIESEERNGTRVTLFW